MKYIHHKDFGYILFSDTKRHDDMAKKLGWDINDIDTAGCAGIIESTGEVFCYGESITLGAHSSKEDGDALNRLFNKF